VSNLNQFQPGGSIDDVLPLNGLAFRKGKVKRVLSDSITLDADTAHLKGDMPKGGMNNCIAFIDIQDADTDLEDQMPFLLAQPLFRGFSDSILAGEIVLITSIQDRNYYLGPINTHNLPSLASDTVQYTKVSEVGIDTDGLPKGYVATDEKPFAKLFSPLDNLYAKGGMEYDSVVANKQYFSDVTIEGRHNNVINLGSRDTRPYIFIRNNEHHEKTGVRDDVDKKINKFGSVLGMLSIGTVQQNILGINELSYNERLDEYKSAEETRPWNPINIVDENNSYGQLTDDSTYDQVILFSDKITFDARRNDLNISAYRNVNIGVGENFVLNTIGFSVINSSNIYLGEEAKSKTEPIVLGNELRLILLEIMNILQKSRALVQGVPIPFVDENSAPMYPEIQTVIDKLNDMIPEGESIKENPNTKSINFLSTHHYIEKNSNNQKTTE